jgi:hypothetical protein
MLEFTPLQFRTQEICFAALHSLGALMFVPNKFKTPDFFLSAFKNNHSHIKHIPAKYLTYDMCREAVEDVFVNVKECIPEQFRTEELWRIALTSYGYRLMELPSALMSEEFCRLAVNSYGRSLEFVPEQFRTKELFFDAVREDGKALKYIDINKLTGDEYTEICRAALERVRPF